jgi:rhomboid protease GluP
VTRPRTLADRVPATAIVWTIAAINLAIFGLTEFVGGSTNPRVLVAFGAKVNILIAHGEYLRLLTAAFLHVGVAHLLLNMFSLLSIGRMAEMIYGHTRFLSIYLLSALSGSLFSYLFSRSLSAGASGAIFGIAGALVVFFARHRKVPAVSSGGQLSGFIFILVINGLYGLVQSNIDNFAHFGGLAAGMVTGAALGPRISMVVGPEGEPLGLRRDPSPRLHWLVVPIALLLIAVIVVNVPGAGLR